jgi:hypothetical protein
MRRMKSTVVNIHAYKRVVLDVMPLMGSWDTVGEWMQQKVQPCTVVLF